MATNDKHIIVRVARREDCGEIMRLIKELAEFEKMPNSVKTTAEILERDGFDNDPPAFLAYVAEDKAVPGKSIGYSICYISYDIFCGKAFFVEDIMVTLSHRNKGIGKRLFQLLCKEALALNCEIILFYVLDWNPANAFYVQMGAVDVTKTEGWHWHIMQKDQIERVANLSGTTENINEDVPQ